MSLQPTRRHAFVTGQVHREFIGKLDPNWTLEEAFTELEDFYEDDGLPEHFYDQVRDEMIDMWDTIANDPEHLER